MSKYITREPHGQRSRRRERAKEREQVRASRNDGEQLSILATRRGLSVRERARLEKRIAE
jgi:hypothetical protein